MTKYLKKKIFVQSVFLTIVEINKKSLWNLYPLFTSPMYIHLSYKDTLYKVKSCSEQRPERHLGWVVVTQGILPTQLSLQLERENSDFATLSPNIKVHPQIFNVTQRTQTRTLQHQSGCKYCQRPSLWAFKSCVQQQASVNNRYGKTLILYKTFIDHFPFYNILYFHTSTI